MIEVTSKEQGDVDIPFNLLVTNESIGGRVSSCIETERERE